ncbi:MAG: hypothetical protein ACI39R_08860 [Lachnospiraceae bacterium]
MKNLFIEGIQGAGKSTLVNYLSNTVPEFSVCREGDYSPVDLAWCTWMSKSDYTAVLKRYESIRDEITKNTVREGEHFVISYTKIITDIPNFHRELENYEVYNGRKTFQELKEIIFSRYKVFSQTGYLFECSFFQNIMEELMLFHLLNDQEIMEFYRELYGIINPEQFLLLYLYSYKPEENIRIIQKERCDHRGNELWYPMMLQYFIHSPYGEKHGCATFEDMIAHFKHRQELEVKIIKEIIGDRAVILPTKEWRPDEINSFLHNL